MENYRTWKITAHVHTFIAKKLTICANVNCIPNMETANCGKLPQMKQLSPLANYYKWKTTTNGKLHKHTFKVQTEYLRKNESPKMEPPSVKNYSKWKIYHKRKTYHILQT